MAKHKKQIIDCTRRGLIRSSGALMTLPFLTRAHGAMAEGSSEPHFFLNIMFDGAIDPSYFFDSRPLSFTDNGKMVNYLYKNADKTKDVFKNAAPTPYVGTNGGSTLTSPLVQDLLKNHKDIFTIVNGVMMLPNGLEGHGQNSYYLFSGKSDNHNSFMPVVGRSTNSPLENIHLGGFPSDIATPTNFSSSIQFNNETINNGIDLVQTLEEGAKLRESSLLGRFLMDSANNNTAASLFGQGSKMMADNIPKVDSLAEKLQEFTTEGDFETVRNPALSRKLELVKSAFSAGISQSATITMNYFSITLPDGSVSTIDVHGAQTAQNSKEIYGVVASDLDEIFNYLKTTQFDDSRSLLDVTTVMITSEFSRTMRQFNVDIDNTGTDHNPLNNTVLLAGKGIKTGMVVGSSDLNEIDEAGEFANVSGAHISREKILQGGGFTTERIKYIMGSPFDISSMAPKTTQPDDFNVEEYISMPNIVNTLMDMAGATRGDLFGLPGADTQTKAEILNGLKK
jgi:hypothetical protein